MIAIRVLRTCAILLLVATTSLATAQTPSADLQKQLESSFALTKATADHTDIVTGGAVLVLQKDNLEMCPANLPIPTHNFFKNGQVTQGGLLGVFGKLGNASLTGADANATRKFVAGEKFWVTKIIVENDGVSFEFLSDPFQDVRYRALLKFPYARGQIPAADQMLATIGQVIKTDGGDNGGAAPDQQQADAPAPETKTIALGQTKDQVAQMFGQPKRVVQLGAKEIDYYTDMKVTFVKNVVTNVE